MANLNLQLLGRFFGAIWKWNKHDVFFPEETGSWFSFGNSQTGFLVGFLWKQKQQLVKFVWFRNSFGAPVFVLEVWFLFSFSSTSSSQKWRPLFFSHCQRLLKWVHFNNFGGHFESSHGLTSSCNAPTASQMSEGRGHQNTTTSGDLSEPLQEKRAYIGHLEPKLPCFWFEKALFWGVDLQKQKSFWALGT